MKFEIVDRDTRLNHGQAYHAMYEDGAVVAAFSAGPVAEFYKREGPTLLIYNDTTCCWDEVRDNCLPPNPVYFRYAKEVEDPADVSARLDKLEKIVTRIDNTVTDLKISAKPAKEFDGEAFLSSVLDLSLIHI